MKFQKHDIRQIDPETAERIMADCPADWQMDRVLQKSLRKAARTEGITRRYSRRTITAFACAGLAFACGMTALISYRISQNGYRIPEDSAHAVEEPGALSANEPAQTTTRYCAPGIEGPYIEPSIIIPEHDYGEITVFGLIPSKEGVEEFAKRAYEKGSSAEYDPTLDEMDGSDMVRADLMAIRDNLDVVYNVTPPEITEKFGFRIFKETKFCTSYLLTENGLCILGCGAGGAGTISFAVADIDPDAEGYELYYTYSWGYGMHRSQVGAVGLADLSQRLDIVSLRTYVLGEDLALYAENGRLYAGLVNIADSGAVSVVEMNLKPMQDYGEFFLHGNAVIFYSRFEPDRIPAQTTAASTAPAQTTTTQTTTAPQISYPLDVTLFHVENRGENAEAFLALAEKLQLSLPSGDWLQIAPAEIEEKYDLHIFRHSADYYNSETYLMRGGKITKLGEAFGGAGVHSYALADIDGNGTPELYYIYNYGSGVNYSALSYYDLATDAVCGLGLWPDMGGQPAPESFYCKPGCLCISDHSDGGTIDGIQLCDHENGSCYKDDPVFAVVTADKSGIHLSIE